MSQQRLVAANALKNPESLRVGQRLNVPGCRRATRSPAPPPPPIQLDDGLLLAHVGPDRIPTRLYVNAPDLAEIPIAFIWPVEGTVSSEFGRRRRGWHAGIDIHAELGTPVRASAAGTVIFSGWAASYGRAVKIQHSDGFVTVYAHNNENLVEVGEEVAAGAIIALVGRSGRASAEHLHFEIRRDGMAYNPLHLLDANDTRPVLVSTITDTPSDDADDDIRD